MLHIPITKTLAQRSENPVTLVQSLCEAREQKQKNLLKQQIVLPITVTTIQSEGGGNPRMVQKKVKTIDGLIDELSFCEDLSFQKATVSSLNPLTVKVPIGQFFTLFKYKTQKSALLLFSIEQH